ncbi:hypothetical protein [Micromonospora deserti]|uniref:Uncharacterized protein n=1 Tax=Micromonospora deserti TaxID=2070366 RepID=A0A2W2BBQ8_9ACTN|nr:hypothetical protein [Micromonospora deserti]PZF85051.1 hypothetical protein C1I99_29900 [Micromonospora deserti]
MAFFAIGCTALAVAGVVFIFDLFGDHDVPRGLYAIVAASIVIGGDGWTVLWAISQAEKRVQRSVTPEIAGLRKGIERRDKQLAELTSRMDALIDRLEGAAPSRPRPTHVAASCRAVGHTYMSQGYQEARVGIVRPSAVDADTLAAMQRLNLRLLRGGDS